MTVRDVSGKAIANLNYEKVNHHNPVYIGDTISSYSIIEKKEVSKSNNKNAKIKIMTIANNQNKQKVLSFQRTILIKIK
jgi:acyl dehydratase